MSERIYIAGPMRGKPGLNWSAFDDAAQRLRVLGYVPINPADVDRDSGIRNDVPLLEQNWSLVDIARECIIDVSECDGVALLPGWHESAGARAEAAFAEWIGIEVKPLEDWL